MQKYDIALKSLLQTSDVSVLEQLAGVHLARWINVELPQVQTARLDLLGETEAGELFHFELQRPSPGMGRGASPCLSGEQLQELSDRLLDAQDLEDLFELR
jgi:hypothetical protein